MTSEIAVLNKFGLSIAADSAITVEQFHDNELITKTYNSANKLFTLSKHAPVAAMFYNSVNIGGVPWETVIKSYRSQLKETTFGTLQEYSDDFFEYLEGNEKLFPPERIERIVGINLFRALNPIQKESKNRVVFTQKLDAKIAELEKIDRLGSLPADYEARLKADYRSTFDYWTGIVLPNSYITGNKTRLRRFAELVFSREQKLSGYSGVVIAGFGDDEYLPSLLHHNCDCIVNGCVRRWLLKSVEISDDNQGVVVPLADSEITETLLSGINPRFKGRAYEEALKVMLGIPDIVVNSIPGLTPGSQKLIRDAARQSISGSFRDFYNGVEDLRRNEYEQPINRTISSLPIAELGQVAETFINASHIHKRVNPGFETVGGPVDVAVVSKGDGFVWVKRKHYFDESINPTFALRYLD